MLLSKITPVLIQKEVGICKETQKLSPFVTMYALVKPAKNITIENIDITAPVTSSAIIVSGDSHHLSFQGNRIYINSELEEIHKVLDGALDILAVGGQLSVISFHSLEDRIVKRFIRKHEKGPEYPAGLPLTDAQMQVGKNIKSIGKAIKPSAEEIDKNPRSRSSVLRVAAKLRQPEE